MRRQRVQQLVIPKGVLSEEEAAVIEIPRRFQRAPVVVLKRRFGERAESRAAEYFIDAPDGEYPMFQNYRRPNSAGSRRYQNVPQQIPQECGGPQQVISQSQQPNVCPSFASATSSAVPPPPPQIPQQGATCPSSVTYATTTPVQIFPQPGVSCPSAPSFTAPQPASVQPSVSLSSGYNTYTTFAPPNSAHSTMTPSTYQPMYPASAFYPMPGAPCPAMVDLSLKEYREKDLISRSLDEFQKARRKFLTQTRILKPKRSCTDSSDSD